MTFVTQQRSNASQGLTKQLNDLEVVLYHELDVPDHKSRCICIIEHYVSKHEVNKENWIIMWFMELTSFITYSSRLSGADFIAVRLGGRRVDSIARYNPTWQLFPTSKILENKRLQETQSVPVNQIQSGSLIWPMIWPRYCSLSCIGIWFGHACAWVDCLGLIGSRTISSVAETSLSSITMHIS